MAFLGFRNKGQPTTAEMTQLACPYKLCMCERDFVRVKTLALLERILKRCYHKTAGIDRQVSDKIAQSVFLSVESGAEQNGTIPLVARAMLDRQKIYLVYSESLGLVRKATSDEQRELTEAYKNNNNATGRLRDGKRGMVLNFANYDLVQLIKCYMTLIYAVMDSGNTQVNLSRSLQIKINKLRDNISVLTSDDAIKQSNNINDALKRGNSVLLDNLDNVIQTAVNADSTQKALDIFYSALAADIGLSMSFVSGVLTSGMSATGDADINYEENGIKDFWTTIWRPICVKLYGQEQIHFDTDRWRNLTARLQNLVYVENSSLFTDEQKKQFAESILND